jgi:hypothetical protein
MDRDGLTWAHVELWDKRTSGLGPGSYSDRFHHERYALDGESVR